MTMMVKKEDEEAEDDNDQGRVFSKPDPGLVKFFLLDF